MLASIRNKRLVILWMLVLSLIVGMNYCYGFIQVHGESMEPSISNDTIFILNKFAYKLGSPQRFDLIVFEKNDKIYIKRVIGLPGEQLEYRGNKLYINNKLYPETGFTRTKTNDFRLNEVTSKEVVPSNTYFVLGDNRSHSMDSRILGFINGQEIKGKVIH